MYDDRAQRIAARFSLSAGAPPTENLCTTCVDILDVVGAGISIMSGRNSGPVCSSSESVRRLEYLQFSLGEGPCHDAYTTGTMIAEPDLATRTIGSWPNYAAPALHLGACAVFAFPLHLGAGIIGVLTLYQDTVGMLTNDQDADGSEVARMLPAFMNAIQDRSAEPLLAEELSDTSAHRAEVHQAAGITAIQLGITVDDALIRIRAYAYATSQTVAHISQEILAHRLELGDDGPGQPGASA